MTKEKGEPRRASAQSDTDDDAADSTNAKKKRSPPKKKQEEAAGAKKKAVVAERVRDGKGRHEKESSSKPDKMAAVRSHRRGAPSGPRKKLGRALSKATIKKLGWRAGVCRIWSDAIGPAHSKIVKVVGAYVRSCRAAADCKASDKKDDDEEDRKHGTMVDGKMAISAVNSVWKKIKLMA